ncbi:hypothetical protein ACO0LB_19030 [Undibacterium sp. SXout7W]|uniref:hypothetical protein n=1 Tax=Undibacterium sp. SXout7W TaxID=3413049 RepID=UPI003BF201A6
MKINWTNWTNTHLIPVSMKLFAAARVWGEKLHCLFQLLQFRLFMLRKNTMVMFGMICFDPQQCSAMCGKIKMLIENTGKIRIESATS